jgi:hypothetical protein
MDLLSAAADGYLDSQGCDSTSNIFLRIAVSGTVHELQYIRVSEHQARYCNSDHTKLVDKYLLEGCSFGLS